MPTFRENFPTVIAAGGTLKLLLASDQFALLVAAVVYVAAIIAGWVLMVFRGTDELLGYRLTPLFYIWTLSGIAVIGVWSTLGGGAWHWRFLSACCAALFMLAALLRILDSPWLGIRGEPERLANYALLMFASAAFSALWLGSLGQLRIVRPIGSSLVGSLRTGQFNIATLLVLTTAIAAMLGAAKISWRLFPALQRARFDLGDGEAWASATWVCVLTLIACAAMLRSRKVMFIVVPSVFIALWIAGLWHRTLERALPDSSYFWWLAVSMRFKGVGEMFGCVVVQFLCLRIMGFRLLRMESGERVAAA
jgi:hypothetical protein